MRRAAGLSVESGVVGRYVHTQISDGLGKIAVIVALESKGDKEVLATLARQLAMHVASANPLAMTAAELDAATVEREKNLLGREERRQAAACAGEDHRIRPQDLLQGSLLPEQVSNHPDHAGKTVAQAVKETEGKAGAPIAIKGFVRYALGEGIEKATGDFAAEVAAAVKG